MVRATMQGVADKNELELTLPELALCTDNGAMIAYAGWLFSEAGYSHGLEFEAIARGRVVPLDWVVSGYNIKE